MQAPCRTNSIDVPFTIHHYDQHELLHRYRTMLNLTRIAALGLPFSFFFLFLGLRITISQLLSDLPVAHSWTWNFKVESWPNYSNDPASPLWHRISCKRRSPNSIAPPRLCPSFLDHLPLGHARQNRYWLLTKEKKSLFLEALESRDIPSSSTNWGLNASWNTELYSKHLSVQLTSTTASVW